MLMLLFVLGLLPPLAVLLLLLLLLPLGTRRSSQRLKSVH